MALKGPAALCYPAVQRTQNSKNHIYVILTPVALKHTILLSKILSSGCCDMSGCRIIFWGRNMILHPDIQTLTIRYKLNLEVTIHWNKKQCIRVLIRTAMYHMFFDVISLGG